MALRLRSQNERSSEANLLNLLGGDAVAGDMVYAIIAPHELVDQHGVETPVHLEQFAGSVRKYIYWSIEPSAPVGQASACPGLLHHTLPSPNAIAKRPVCGPRFRSAARGIPVIGDPLRPTAQLLRTCLLRGGMPCRVGHSVNSNKRLAIFAHLHYVSSSTKSSEAPHEWGHR